MANERLKLHFSKVFLKGEANFGLWDTVSTGIGFLNTFLIISTLTVYEYGLFQLILSGYAIANNVLYLGSSVVNTDIFRFIGQGKESQAKRLFLEYQIPRFLLGLGMASFIFFGTSFFSRWYSQDVISNIKPLAFLLILEVIFTNLKVLLGYRLKFRLMASRATLYKIAQLGLLLYFFFGKGFGIKEVIYSMIFGSVITIIILILPAWRSYRVWHVISASDNSLIVGIFKAHGKWDFFQQFTSKLTSNLQPWIIKHFISTEAVAVYSIAQSMAVTLVGFFPNKTLNSLVPLQISDSKKMYRIYRIMSKYLSLLAVIIGIIGAVIFPIIIYTIFPKYIQSLQYFWGLLLWLPISALGSVATVYLVVLQKQKYLFYQKAIKSLTTITLMLFAYLLGLWGLVLHQIIFSAAMFYTIYIFLRRADSGYRLRILDFFRFDEEDKVYKDLLVTKLSESIRKKISSFL